MGAEQCSKRTVDLASSFLPLFKVCLLNAYIRVSGSSKLCSAYSTHFFITARMAMV